MKRHHHHLRVATVLLVVLALGLRSLIPAGYMPDFSGHGLFTYCDGVNHMAGHAGHMHGGHAHTDTCPFAEGAVYGFAGIKAPVIAAPVYTASADALVPATLFAQRARFASASPRSPPFFS